MFVFGFNSLLPKLLKTFLHFTFFGKFFHRRRVIWGKKEFLNIFPTFLKGMWSCAISVFKIWFWQLIHCIGVKTHWLICQCFIKFSLDISPNKPPWVTIHKIFKFWFTLIYPLTYLYNRLRIDISIKSDSKLHNRIKNIEHRIIGD